MKKSQNSFENRPNSRQNLKLYHSKSHRSAMTLPTGDRPKSHVLLVVEEDDGVRELLETAMSMQGFEVLSCSNGAQALDIYQREGERIELVLMDVNMPGLSGSQTLDRLRQFNQQVRCCFMSGDTSGSDWPMLLKKGALCVFTKPFPSMLRLAESLKHFAAPGKLAKD